MSDASTEPFKQLGERLRTIRQKLRESVAQVSGAVEIDELTLARIERGAECPSEDILSLLISHFEMQGEEAKGLWNLAGYEPQMPRDHHDHSGHGQATILVMAVDPRIMYSDGVRVVADQKGVVLNFLQNNDTPQGLTTSRIGMSRVQAEQLLISLQRSLQSTTPKSLPPFTDDQQKSK